MYPHERSLVKRLEGKPFALLGINSDKTIPEVQAVAERERITWPSWFDGGGTSGPIATFYGVTSWPTTYVLDPKGVIRFKDVRGEELDKAVNSLMEEFGLTDVVLPRPKSQATTKSSRSRPTKGEKTKPKEVKDRSDEPG